MVLLSTDNICFGLEIKKISFWYALLTKGLQASLKVSKTLLQTATLTFILPLLFVLNYQYAFSLYCTPFAAYILMHSRILFLRSKHYEP